MQSSDEYVSVCYQFQQMSSITITGGMDAGTLGLERYRGDSEDAQGGELENAQLQRYGCSSTETRPKLPLAL